MKTDPKSGRSFCVAEPPPRPQQDFTFGGWRPTGRFRIRAGMFLPRVEELWERTDGTFQWKKLPWMHSVEIKAEMI
jgi:hypothetical protein